MERGRRIRDWSVIRLSPRARDEQSWSSAALKDGERGVVAGIGGYWWSVVGSCGYSWVVVDIRGYLGTRPVIVGCVGWFQWLGISG